MNRGEAEKELHRAGFVKEERSKHVVWKNGDILVTLHRGTKTTDRLLRQVRQAVRRSEKRDVFDTISKQERISFFVPHNHDGSVVRMHTLDTTPTPVTPVEEVTPVSTEPEKRLHNAKYTAEDMVEVEQYYKEGKSDQEIADAMKETHPGLTKKLVTYIRLYHLKLKRKEMSPKTPKPPPQRRHYSKKEMGILRKMNADGYTDAEIAKVISESRPSTTENAIASVRQKKGLAKGSRQMPLPLDRPPPSAFEPLDSKASDFEVTIMEGNKVKVKCPVSRDTAKTIVDMLMGW
jgi:hypothetical protein